MSVKRKKVRAGLNDFQILKAIEMRKRGASLTDIANRFGVSHTQAGFYVFGMDGSFTDDKKELFKNVYQDIENGLSREQVGTKYGISAFAVAKYYLAGYRLVNTPEIFGEQKDSQITIEDVTDSQQDGCNNLEDQRIVYVEKKTSRVQLLMQPSVLEKARAAAASGNISLNEYICKAIINDLNGFDGVPEPASRSANKSIKGKLSDLILDAVCSNDFELCVLLATIGEFLVKREGENNEH